MNTIYDTRLIFNEIKNHYNIKNDAELSRFLGIATTTLASWYRRNTFDIHLVYAKCTDIDANWLLTGKGNIIRNSINYNNQNEHITPFSNEDVTDWKGEYFKEKEKCEQLNGKYITLLEKFVK
ncbi:helix-turn-helix domain-containing protein [Sphingobacteriaceae bacterium WQ 2009]|uniref:Helix-turn-helix domain-containing protein n=1 Tax=Rhinopithecimicrobium faecis TaxID=2820698 RepID=A0A8T4HGC6_9SPHI|nr:helix-turn-helix domain-containing protein [Sphingobacteriaceae bacterium WQ 2009]